MALDIHFSFDSTDLEDARWINRILAYKQGRATGVPIELVRRIKRSKVGQDFVLPLARTLTAGQHYSAAQLASILGAGWTTKKVVSKLNVMGRPESRHHARIFARPTPGRYALNAAMQAALLDPNIT